MSEKQSIEEVTRSLTGFDEIAIEKAFGKPVFELSPTTTARALLFVLKRRGNASDFDSFEGVMSLPLGDVNDAFVEGESDSLGKA